jgi:hypothetical protein
MSTPQLELQSKNGTEVGVLFSQLEVFFEQKNITPQVVINVLDAAITTGVSVLQYDDLVVYNHHFEDLKSHFIDQLTLYQQLARLDELQQARADDDGFSVSTPPITPLAHTKTINHQPTRPKENLLGQPLKESVYSSSKSISLLSLVISDEAAEVLYRSVKDTVSNIQKVVGELEYDERSRKIISHRHIHTFKNGGIAIFDYLVKELRLQQPPYARYEFSEPSWRCQISLPGKVTETVEFSHDKGLTPFLHDIFTESILPTERQARLSGIRVTSSQSRFKDVSLDQLLNMLSAIDEQDEFIPDLENDIEPEEVLSDASEPKKVDELYQKMIPYGEVRREVQETSTQWLTSDHFYYKGTKCVLKLILDKDQQKAQFSIIVEDKGDRASSSPYSEAMVPVVIAITQNDRVAAVEKLQSLSTENSKVSKLQTFLLSLFSETNK